MPWMETRNFDFYRLNSFIYIQKQDKEELEYISSYKDFILDSGIFTYLIGTKKNDIKWENYVDVYADFVREHNIRQYMEVDVDAMIGLKETEKLTTRLNRRVGWNCIPIWHKNRGYDKWIEICKENNYVAFGSFITEALDKSKFGIIARFIEDAEKNGSKVHGLGFTQFDWLKRLHFYSVDSSSWTSGVRFGTISLFKNDRIVGTKKPENMRFKDYKLVAKHNFEQWLRFSAYAEKCL